MNNGVSIEAYFQRKDNRGAVSVHTTCAERSRSKRDIVNAILYVTKTGAQWRLLPREFPPWQTVYGHYRRWNHRGVWEQALDELNRQHRKKTPGTPRRAMGSSTRKVSKSCTPLSNGASMGGKKVKGRKRHIVVDTLGNLIAVIVHAANIHDTIAGVTCSKPPRASRTRSKRFPPTPDTVARP